jgi:hypothetical protein
LGFFCVPSQKYHANAIFAEYWFYSAQKSSLFVVFDRVSSTLLLRRSYGRRSIRRRKTASSSSAPTESKECVPYEFIRSDRIVASEIFSLKSEFAIVGGAYAALVRAGVLPERPGYIRMNSLTQGESGWRTDWIKIPKIHFNCLDPRSTYPTVASDEDILHVAGPPMPQRRTMRPGAAVVPVRHGDITHRLETLDGEGAEAELRVEDFSHGTYLVLLSSCGFSVMHIAEMLEDAATFLYENRFLRPCNMPGELDQQDKYTVAFAMPQLAARGGHIYIRVCSRRFVSACRMLTRFRHAEYSRPCVLVSGASARR